MSEMLIFLRRLVDRLDAASAPYMICGSVASGLYGEMRQTQDLDVVIDPTGAEFARLIKSFGDDFYVDADAARFAFEHGEMFNVIDRTTMWKADLILLKDQPFYHSEFARARTFDIEGRSVRVASPEDIVLAKLQWARIGSSERQMRDVVTVIKHRHNELDREYLDHWAARLGVCDLLAVVMRDAALEQPRGDELG